MYFSKQNFKQILRTTFLIMVSFFCFGFFSPAGASEGKSIDVSLSRQTLTLLQDGKSVGSYKISSGKKSMATPRGNFQIYNKTSKAWSEKYKLFMPYWMAFTPDGSHGIHELPEWPNGRKEGASHLGIPVSHGCVRLGVGSARTVYNWADVGTPVIIH